MGYDTGNFKDRDGNEYSVGVTCGSVIVWKGIWCGNRIVIRLDPKEAENLYKALDEAIRYYISDGNRLA
jgi:hypothetical protein